MTFTEKEEYIWYRINSAYNTYEAAKVLADKGFWNSAVNRLYYSAFYAVNALLVLDNHRVKTHSGTKSQFSAHYVKTGKFEKNMVRCSQSSLIGVRKETMTIFLIMTKNQ
jgi:uncharacterized protein (UPF0332 family)